MGVQASQLAQYKMVQLFFHHKSKAASALALRGIKFWKCLFKLLCLLLVVSPFGIAVDIKALNPIQTIEVLPEGFKEPIRYNITLPDGYSADANKRYFVLFDLHPRSQPFIAGMQIQRHANTETGIS